MANVILGLRGLLDAWGGHIPARGAAEHPRLREHLQACIGRVQKSCDVPDESLCAVEPVYDRLVSAIADSAPRG